MTTATKWPLYFKKHITWEPAHIPQYFVEFTHNNMLNILSGIQSQSENHVSCRWDCQGAKLLGNIIK